MRPLLTYIIEKSPLKSNLTFTVSYISNDLKLNHVFYSLIQELNNFGDKTERTIVFCQTRNQCALIWRILALELGQKLFKSRKVSPHHRLVEMFHAGSPKSVKEHVLLEIGKEDSCLCILICTIAFGMGIDCKGVHRVIHFGASKTIESYLQECGRAGRDNQPSVCYLLYNGFLASHCSSEMKKFVQSLTCRKDSIAENFPGNHGQITKVCSCCDVCLSKCECKSPCDKKYAQFGKITTDMSTNIAKKSRVVSADQRGVLKSKLTAYDELHKRVTRNTVKPISYPNLLLEFGHFQIQQVINKCEHLFTLEDILDNIESGGFFMPITFWLHYRKLLMTLILTLMSCNYLIQMKRWKMNCWISSRTSEMTHRWIYWLTVLKLRKLPNLWMSMISQSGVTNTSLTEIIDCVSVKLNLLTVPVVEDMETDDIYC